VAEAAPPLAFSYSRALAPLMWAFVCIMAVELAVVHLLVASLWSGTAAGLLSAVALATMIWIVVLIRSFARLPVTVGDHEVVMRLGSLRTARIPARRIAGVRTGWPSGAEKQPGVLNLALINYPNVMLDLDPPLAGTGRRNRAVSAVAHRLDDAGGFTDAVKRILASRAHA
jgi:hypothetical protein